jgi:hypothetical protein
MVQVSYSMSVSVQLSSQEPAIGISDYSTSSKQRTTWHGWCRYHHHHHYSRLGSRGTSDQRDHSCSTHQVSSMRLLASHPCQDKDPTIDSDSLSPSGSPGRTWNRKTSSSGWGFGCLTWNPLGIAVKLAVVHLPGAVARRTTWKSHKSHHPGWFVAVVHQKETWNAQVRGENVATL